MAEVNSKVLPGIGLGVAGDLGKPRARHHDRRRSHKPALKRVDGGGVGGMAHTGVIAIDNQQLVGCLVAKALGECLAICLAQEGGK